MSSRATVKFYTKVFDSDYASFYFTSIYSTIDYYAYIHNLHESSLAAPLNYITSSTQDSIEVS